MKKILKGRDKVKKYCKIVIYTLLVILTMSYIFSNSLQSSEISNGRSGKIVEFISSIINNKIPKETLNIIIRKLAHGTEFAILGVFLGLLTYEISKLRKQAIISFPLLISLCTAVTDEFIQSFNNRSESIKDILIDFGGAISGLLIISLVLLLIKKYRRIRF